MKAKINYVSKFKYLILIPIILALASIVIGTIFNLNFDYDFRKINNFDVKFNTTVSSSEYDILENKLESLIKNNGFDDFRLERIGSGAQNGLLVKIPNESKNTEDKIATLKTTIEDTLLANCENIESSVVITTTNTGFSLPKNVSNMIWLSVLAVSCIIIFVFFYNWIRYNLIAGATLALSILIEIAMLVAAMITFRIPFNYYFVVPFVIMILTTIINATYMNNYIKSTLTLDSYAKTTNAERVEETTRMSIKGILTYTIILIALILAIMFFGGLSLIYLGLAIITGLVISAFVSLLINPSLWSFWYKKDKDATLRRRIASEQRKADLKSGKVKDEKIVV